MSSRFPLNEANPEFVGYLEEEVHKIHGETLPFEWKTAENALFGPYPALLHSPKITPVFWEMAKVTTDPESVTVRNRELAILGMLSLISSPFVAYSHRLIAIHRAGITEEQYRLGLLGTTPKDLDEREEMAYRLGRILVDLKGPLSDEIWNDALTALGRKEVLGIVHIVGSYIYIAMLSNVNGKDDRFS